MLFRSKIQIFIDIVSGNAANSAEKSFEILHIYTESASAKMKQNTSYNTERSIIILY